MDKKDILSRVDHTLLKQTATWEQIEKLCREGMEYAAASVCIPPCYVKQAKDFVGDKLAVCTVIGFPNGNMTTAVKVFETEDAVKNGADEIDMVINIGLVKAGHYDQVLDEIRQIKAACGGRCLKVHRAGRRPAGNQQADSIGGSRAINGSYSRKYLDAGALV